MTITVSLTKDDIQAALGNFLEAILPSGTEVIVAQVNRVPEPRAANFVIMNWIRRPRLATNFEDFADVEFTASIAGELMTVATIAFGTIPVEATMYGTALAAGTATIVEQVSGLSGGTGVYRLETNQGTIGANSFAAGGVEVIQATEAVIQIDVHGPLSGDWAQIISTLYRDEYACDFLAATGVSPLYADDPQQLAFTNAEKQYEDRWTMVLHMQVDPAVRLPQQFATSAEIELISVEAEYPL